MAKREKNEKGRMKILKISITDADTGENIFSKIVSRPLVITAAVTAVICIITCTCCIMAYTPVRTLIPGYPTRQSRMTAVQNQIKIDSLERAISLWALQVSNIQRVITGREPVDLDSIEVYHSEEVPDYYRALYARQDSVLKAVVAQKEEFAIAARASGIKQIEGLHYFTPVKGIITEHYNKAIGHPYVDIAVEDNTNVYSILDGTVINAVWNDDTGYTMQIQHDNNLISFYKHNAQLLKKTGDKVKAGTPVAIAGNTGKLTTGAHLHFELWHEGEPVNPEELINF